MITVKKDALKYKDSDGSMQSAGVLCKVGVNSNQSSVGGAAIIDCTTLPSENINEGAFYRLLKADYVIYQEILDNPNFNIYCVDSLPEIGEVVTDAEMSFIKLYYSIQDNNVYGYVDDLLASAFGFPMSGWIEYATLCEFTGEPYGGVINCIDEALNYDYWYVLLSYSLYTYKDGWVELPYGYELPPKFDITWDGEIGDKLTLDMSALGFENTYMVKVSDEVFTVDQLIGATLTQSFGYSCVLEESLLDTISYTGAITIDGGSIVIIYSSEETNMALGLPSGYLSNGTYFVKVEDGWTNRLFSRMLVNKIDNKYIDIHNLGLETVAFTGSYSDLYGKPTIYTDVIRYSTSSQNLSSTYKSNARKNIDVYSKSEVDSKIANTSGVSESKVQTMISEAIGSAIGGSY